MSKGAAILGWIRQARLWRCYEFLKIAAPILLTLAVLWVSVQRTRWSVLAVLVSVLLEVLLGWLGRCERRSLRELLGQLNKQMAGNIAAVIRIYKQRQSLEVKPSGLADRCLQLQTDVLRHVTDIVTESVGPTTETISSNWMRTTDDSLALELIVFDRHKVDRRLVRLPLDGHQAGAIEAFKSRDVTVVPNTHDESVKHMFRDNHPYRTILSVPVVLDDRVLGVVNVDSTRERHFQPELAYEILDCVYLIGLLEAIKRERR